MSKRPGVDMTKMSHRRACPISLVRPAVAVLNPAVIFGGNGLPSRKTHESPSVCKRPSPGLPKKFLRPSLGLILTLVNTVLMGSVSAERLKDITQERGEKG